jgi:type II secretory pathway component PulF
MRRHSAAWFDPAEIAGIEAGQHGGNLSSVLRMLAERHERSGELSHRLLSALTYPLIVATAGLFVVVFISTKTLPNLVQVLKDAKIEVPRLTTHVMAVGQFLAGWWWVLALVVIVAPVLILLGRRVLERIGVSLPWRLPTPAVVRRLAIASFALRFAELLRSGVPLVEALRVLSPTAAHRALRATIGDVAARVERGEDLSLALEASAAERWFDEEFRRLVEIGQASGELETLLERIGHRYERQARRLIDRLTTLLEPFVILTLALLIGMVVMAAILPIVRLQEIFR